MTQRVGLCNRVPTSISKRFKTPPESYILWNLHQTRHSPEPCTLLGICDRWNASNLSNKRNMNDEKVRTPRNGGADSPHLIRPAIPQSAHSRLLSCAQRIPHAPLTWPDACIITKNENRK